MTPYAHARRFIGLREVPGEADHPWIRWAHSLTTLGESPDEVPWCSSGLNAICFGTGYERSRSAAARSWLGVGTFVQKADATVGEDVVVLSRGDNPTAGHVGLFDGWDFHDDGTYAVRLLGFNQGDAVSIAIFDVRRLLGIRRLARV